MNNNLSLARPKIGRVIATLFLVTIAVLSLSNCSDIDMASQAPESNAQYEPAPAVGMAAPQSLEADEAGMAYLSERESPDMESRHGFVASPVPKKTKDKPAKPIASWKRSQITPNTSRLMIGEDENLALKGMQAKVTINGFRARIVLDHYFFNDHERRFEGTFKLRLPNGANPYFFAFGESETLDKPIFFDQQQIRQMGTEPLEIMKSRESTWQQPKEARMVPKEKAAYAYRETVRRRVDPALMEWSGAGIFSARVFPLNPKKWHRIVIAYDLDLLALGNDLEYRLDLPTDIPQQIADFSITQPPGVEIVLTPTVAQDERKSLVFKATDKAHHQRFETPHLTAITVRIKKPGAVLLTGHDQKTGSYFATSFRAQLPAIANGTNTHTSVFLLDVSLSSNPDRFNVWLKLLQAILNNNRDTIKEFAICFFNIEQFWWQERFIANTPENVQTLLEFAQQLSLEGATDLKAALNEASQPSWLGSSQKSKDIFLLSDGSITWGDDNPYALSQTLASGQTNALFAYNTGLAGTDTRILNHLSRETGGAVFSVVGEAEIEKASIAFRSRPWRLTGIQVTGIAPNNSDILIAGRPRNVFPGQILQLAGRANKAATANNARVILSLEQNGQQIKKEIPLSAPLTSQLTPRLYGQIAVNQLESFASATETMSKAYATHFRITGQTSSLLMLETEADYLRFNIKPEEDAFVVKSKLVNVAIAKVLKQIGDSLGDPKAAFLAWLAKLEKMPGLNLSLPAAFKIVLEQMPRQAFVVYAKPLQAKLRIWGGIPGAVRAQLRSHKLDYDIFTDEAQRRLSAYRPADALRALSSLVENNPGDGVLARDVAYSAIEWGLKGHAYHLFRRVANSRPFEPQTYRAMALVLEKMGQVDLALVYYELGLIGQWDRRFGEFQRIHGIDYLRFLRRIVAGELTSSALDYATMRLDSVQKAFDPGKLDILVALTWNTDGTDVDMHVIEPSGEECYYQHRDTKSGGHLSQDVTQGYGPEMYILPNAKPGVYRVKVKYFSSDANRASTRTKVSATIIEGWGTEHERIRHKTVTLRHGKEMHDIATIKVAQ
jgi:tetratricopeptide (TPR) repeat protein